MPDESLERVVMIAGVPECQMILGALSELSDDARKHLDGILSLGGIRVTDARFIKMVLDLPIAVIFLVYLGLKRLECGNPYWTTDGYPENCMRRPAPSSSVLRFVETRLNSIPLITPSPLRS